MLSCATSQTPALAAPFSVFAGNRLFADVSLVYGQLSSLCNLRGLHSQKIVPLARSLFLSRGCGDQNDAIMLAIRFGVPVWFFGETTAKPQIKGYTWRRRPGALGIPHIPCYRLEAVNTLF